MGPAMEAVRICGTTGSICKATGCYFEMVSRMFGFCLVQFQLGVYSPLLSDTYSFPV